MTGADTPAVSAPSEFQQERMVVSSMDVWTARRPPQSATQVEHDHPVDLPVALPVDVPCP